MRISKKVNTYGKSKWESHVSKQTLYIVSQSANEYGHITASGPAPNVFLCKHDVIRKNRKYITYRNAARGGPSRVCDIAAYTQTDSPGGSTGPGAESAIYQVRF